MLRGERLAVTTGSMNRLTHLKLALATWVKLPEPDEIVVVDWGSTIPVAETILAEFDDPRITVVRTERARWQNSVCHNLEFAFASHLECDLALRLDNDTLVDPAFFAHHPVADNAFYAVNCHEVPAELDDKRNLCGTVFLALRHWRRSNGYNERLVRYGYEDEDFYGRLSRLGLEWRCCQLDDLEHVPHGDEARLAQLPPTPSLSEVSPEVAKQFHIVLSRQIAVALPWSLDDTRTQWMFHRTETPRLVLASSC